VRSKEIVSSLSFLYLLFSFFHVVIIIIVVVVVFCTALFCVRTRKERQYLHNTYNHTIRGYTYHYHPPHFVELWIALGTFFSFTFYFIISWLLSLFQWLQFSFVSLFSYFLFQLSNLFTTSHLLYPLSIPVYLENECIVSFLLYFTSISLFFHGFFPIQTLGIQQYRI